MINEIKIQDGRLDEFFQKSTKEQRFCYFYKRDCGKDVFLRLIETEKNVILSVKEKSIAFSGEHFFISSGEVSVFNYNKMEKRVKCNTFNKPEVLRALIEFPQFDWLKVARDQKYVSDTMFCNSIVRDILLGKLTNAEGIVKKYLALNKIKGVQWKSFAIYSCLYRQFPIVWMDRHTTNINAAMEVMIKGDTDFEGHKPTEEEREKSRLFRDMLFEAMALDVIINPKWSLSRMKEEHQKMTDELMKKDLEGKKQVNIYGDSPKFDYPCKLLSTEREVFMEGSEMHHCLYTCYWHDIKEHKYLAFAFDASERFTLGLKPIDGEWGYDQAYLKYNKQISKESKALIERFLGDSKVKETLQGLIKPPAKPKVIYNQSSEVYDQDLEEWLRDVLAA